MKTCGFCGKEVEQHVNYCDWHCMVEEAKVKGGRIHTPNGLPIRCIRRDYLMTECEHGDHNDYIMPVDAEYVGPEPEKHFASWHGHGCEEPGHHDATPEEVEQQRIETHALIYTDGAVALTMHECNYALWSLKDGLVKAGNYWKKGDWRLTEKSVSQIKGRLKV
jgi:hypothetical protein